MSERAVSLGVVKRLRDAFGDAGGEFVFYQPDLKPPPAACSFRTAPYLVTVGRASSQRGPAQGGQVNDRVYTVQVCVTAWLAYAPADRQGNELAGDAADPFFAETDPAGTDAPPGAVEVADRIEVYLLEDYDAVAAMNAFLDPTATNGFCEPFHACGIGDAQPQGPAWVGSEDKATDSEVWTVTLTLSGARRIRVQGTL